MDSHTREQSRRDEETINRRSDRPNHGNQRDTGLYVAQPPPFVKQRLCSAMFYLSNYVILFLGCASSPTIIICKLRRGREHPSSLLPLVT